METKTVSGKTPTNAIREVFEYINRFKDQVFILKVDDDLLKTPLFPLLIKDIVLIKNMGIKVILVLGAKFSIDEVLATYGEKTKSLNGIRITTDRALQLVKIGASNVSNKVLTLLTENGAHGVLGNWVKARGKGVINGLDYQNSGVVDSVEIPVIESLLDRDHIPIISNIGWSAAGKPYNISSNELAVSLAKTIRASKLFFISTRKGIPAVKNCVVENMDVRECGVYSNMELSKAEQLLKHHEAELSRDSAELIRLALEACHRGVNRVHILDGTQDGVLLQEIFSTTGQGTMFHANVHANIRQARTDDIPGILRIMQPYVNEGYMVQRTAQDIAEKLETFYVYGVDEVLHGCGALTCYPSGLAEIEALVVDPNYRGKQTGKKMVHYIIEKARQKKVVTVFVLTTRSIDYFMNLGFSLASVEVLPPEKRDIFNRERNSKILKLEL